MILDLYASLKELPSNVCGKKFNDAGEVMLNLWNVGKDLRSRCVIKFIKDKKLDWGARYDSRSYQIDQAFKEKSINNKLLNQRFLLSDEEELPE